ncbi:MAG TPA: MFS transporter [Ktedonobacterales bacterium]|jgi:MFS family permease
MDTSASPASATKKPGFFINRNFALLWGGQSISNVGDFVFDTTLVLWIATIIASGQSWGPLAVSGVLLTTALPIFLIGPIAGVFVDRWDKRRTMLTMDAARAILIGLLLLVAIGKPPAFWQLSAIYAIVFLASACAQFFNPARFTLLGDIVEEPYRARASGLGQTTQSLATVIGPPIAAPLLFAVGVQWALIVNALSFAASFLTILAMRVPQASSSAADGQHGSFFQDFGAGIRFFVGNRVLVTLLITVILVTLGIGAINALGVFFVIQNLHAPASLYGWLDFSVGIGAIAGAIAASIFASKIGEVRTFWSCLLAAGISVIAFARMTSLPPGLVFAALAGLSIAPVNVVVGPLMLHATPREFLGRATAVLNPVQALASILSITLAGALASTLLHDFHATVAGLAFGPFDTIFMGTGILIMLGGLYAMVSLRGVTLARADTSEPVATAAARQPAAEPETDERPETGASVRQL